MEISAKTKAATAEDELVRKMLASGFNPEVVMDMLDIDVIVRNRDLFVQFGFDPDGMDGLCCTYAETAKRKKQARRLAWLSVFCSAFLFTAVAMLIYRIGSSGNIAPLLLLTMLASLVGLLLTFGIAVRVAVLTTN